MGQKALARSKLQEGGRGRQRREANERARHSRRLPLRHARLRAQLARRRREQEHEQQAKIVVVTQTLNKQNNSNNNKKSKIKKHINKIKQSRGALFLLFFVLKPYITSNNNAAECC